MKKIAAFSLLLFTGLLSGFAQDAKTLYEEGLKLKLGKNTAAAKEKFKQAVALKKDYYEALYELSWCMNDSKDYFGAMTNLRKLRSVPVWNAVPKVYFELGYAFEKQGYQDSAFAAYKKCVELKPDYSGALRQLGYYYYDKDDPRQAIDYFLRYEQNAKTEINDYLYWYRKGFSYNALKLYNDAKPALMKSLTFKTDYINTYLELGFACTKLKEDDAAIEWFKKANIIDPQSHIPYNGIAEVYRDNKKNMEEAMNWYQKALQVKTDERKACFGMGYCLNSKSRFSEAIPYLEKAIAKEATYTAAYVELGYSLFKVGRDTEALEKLNKAMQLNPKNENARFYAGLVYINQKNRTKAQQMADELKSLNSKNADLLQQRVNGM